MLRSLETQRHRGAMTLTHLLQSENYVVAVERLT